MKIFISQPMRYRSNSEIIEERRNILYYLNKLFSEKIELIDSFSEDRLELPLISLGEAIKQLNNADLVVFAPQWEEARGCRIEYQCCREYNKKILIL